MTQRRFSWLSFVGTVSFLVSIAVPIVFYGPLLVAEGRYRIAQVFADDSANLESYAAVAAHVSDPAFSLYIPKIDAESRVVANVDPWDKQTYMDALERGVAHAANTNVPGNGTENIFLFAHSTDSSINIVRHNAVFYLLRELTAGDEVFVTYQNQPYRYEVTERKIVEPEDVQYLTAENDHNREQLILQTCWPPGTTLKRLLVFADAVDTQQAAALIPASR